MGREVYPGGLFADAPEREDNCEVSAVHDSIIVDIREWEDFCVTPCRKHECKILTPDFTVVGDIGNAVLAISDSVIVAVGIRYPTTTNAWCTLFWVKWAAIKGVGYAVIVCIFTLQPDGVGLVVCNHGIEFPVAVEVAEGD
jgi:hypothetical protein